MSPRETRLIPEQSGRLLHSIRQGAENQLTAVITPLSNDFYYYLSLILKRKWILLSTILVVTTISALHTFSLPSIYQAAATLRLQQREYTFMEDGRSMIFHGFDNSEYSNTQVKLVSNPQLVRKVILKLNLQNDPRFFDRSSGGNLVSSIRSLFSRPEARPVATETASFATDERSSVESLTPQQIAAMEPYVAAILSNLRVEPQENTSLINIRFTHTNPETAFRIIDALSKAFVESDNKYEVADSEAASENLAKQVAEVQDTLKRLEGQRLQYLKSHNLPLGQGQGRNLTAERLGTLSGQLLAAENERKNLEALYESSKSADEVWSIPAVRDNKEVQEMRKDIRDLEQRRAALLEVYTTDWPQVRQIDSQLEKLNSNVKASVKEALSSLKSDLEVALARESKLREEYYREQSAANHQSQDEIELASVNQQVDTSKQIYNTLLQPRKSWKLIQSISRTG